MWKSVTPRCPTGRFLLPRYRSVHEKRQGADHSFLSGPWSPMGEGLAKVLLSGWSGSEGHPHDHRKFNSTPIPPAMRPSTRTIKDPQILEVLNHVRLDSVETDLPFPADVCKEDIPSSQETHHARKEEKIAKIRQKLHKKSRQRRVPSSQVGRVWGFGQLATSLMYGKMSESISSAVGLSEKSQGLSEANAERLVSGLSRMRGAALKLGQVLSIQGENFLPPPLQNIFDRLRNSADIMTTSQFEKSMRDNFGPDWEAKFDSFDKEPFAAASIGQVHRATIDGQTVAVKVQYPGVAQSIDSDIANLSRLLKISGLVPKGAFLEKSMAALGKELQIETDYIREARAQLQMERYLKQAELNEFHVPKVFSDHVTPLVLTTELIDGITIEKLTDRSQEVRDSVSRSILNLCLYEIFVFRFMQTDPNWSNFFFEEDTNKINLLDFGACRAYPEEFAEEYQKIVLAAAAQDEKGVYDSSVKLRYLTGNENEAMKEAHTKAVLLLGRPFAQEGLYDFGTETATEEIRSLIPVMLKNREAPPPQETYSLHRKLSGAFLLASKLKAKIDCRELLMNLPEPFKQEWTEENNSQHQP